MDGENNGKAMKSLYFSGWFGGFPIIFGSTPMWFFFNTLGFVMVERIWKHSLLQASLNGTRYLKGSKLMLKCISFVLRWLFPCSIVYGYVWFGLVSKNAPPVFPWQFCAKHGEFTRLSDFKGCKGDVPTTWLADFPHGWTSGLPLVDVLQNGFLFRSLRNESKWRWEQKLPK